MIPFPDNVPVQTGYYYALYYNELHQAWLYKALVFDVESGKWCGPWQWSYDRIPIKEIAGAFRLVPLGLKVREFDPDTHAKYYTECCAKNDAKFVDEE